MLKYCILILFTINNFIINNIAFAVDSENINNWIINNTQKYTLNTNVSQIIFIKYIEKYSAKAMLYEKQVINNRHSWIKTLECPSFVGKNGINKTKEGDKKTPTGDFGIIMAFGIKPNPGTTLNYLQINNNHYCCNDKHYYNKIIDISKYKHKCTGEHLIKFNPEYNYAFFIDYNKECILNKGSAIFFHCTGKSPYTAGCIAISEKNMLFILKKLQPGARIIIN